MAVDAYLNECAALVSRLNRGEINRALLILNSLRARGGRLFLVGNGGGAGHASHAACDFRKIAHMDAYAYDNVSELTARINDDGWDNSTVDWLKGHRFFANDCLFVFSVGGTSEAVSRNLHRAIDHAVERGATILGVCGSKGGALARYATPCITVDSTSTPQIEGLQAVIWHLLASVLAE